MNVDPIVSTNPVMAFPVAKLQKRNRRLIQLSDPIISTLRECIRDFVIVLVDPEGYILRTVGGLKPLKQADKLYFGPGMNWTEKSAGTNGISLSIVSKRPVQMIGVEHYCESHQNWTCSCAPIREHDGNILGYIDISGPREEANSQQLGLVVAAAYAIEDRIRLQWSQDQLIESNKYLEAVLNSLDEGVITTNADGIITGVNRVITRKLQQFPHSLIGQSIRTVFKTGNALMDFTNNRHLYKEPMVLQLTKTQIECNVSVNPIVPEQGVKCGVVFTVSEMKKNPRMPKGLPGCHANYVFNDIIYVSDVMRRTIDLAKRFAQGPSNILILGESGTGKELLAQAIHNVSDCKKGPFVTVNCGAIPIELIQSEFFGYADGAFTGAKKGGKTGKILMANGGTLFLDEIGEMPFNMQVNLLRVLEEREVVPVGGTKAIPVEVRIIAATNKSLYEEVSQGNFREDLYYRLNVLSIPLPPLRTRSEDIVVLAKHYIEKKSRKAGKEIRGIDYGIFAVLEKYSWPGNVRELVNAIEYAINYMRGHKLLKGHLPQYLLKAESEPVPVSSPQIMPLSELEKSVLKKALRHFNGNISKSAKALGIGRNTLYDKIRKYDLNPKIS